jgi:hypothetical protein
MMFILGYFAIALLQFFFNIGLAIVVSPFDGSPEK